jgi:hypothetical protein
MNDDVRSNIHRIFATALKVARSGFDAFRS